MQLLQSNTSRLAAAAIAATAVLMGARALTAPPAAVEVTADRGAARESAPAQATALSESKGSRTAALSPLLDVEGFYALPLGRRIHMTYRSTVDSTVAFQAEEGAGGTAELAMVFDGALEALVVASTDDEFVMQVTLSESDFQLTAPGQDVDPSVVAGLVERTEAPMLVRMTRDGNIRGYRFGECTDTQTRNLHRTLWSSATALFEGQGEPSWVSAREDGSGPFEMQYRWEPALDGAAPTVLGMAKITQLTGGDEGVFRLLASQGTFEVDSAARWAASVEYEETLELWIASAGTTVTVATASRFALTDIDDASSSELDRDFDWDAHWMPASGAQDAEAPVHFESQATRELKELGVEGLALRIDALIAAGERDSAELSEAQRALASLMADDPKAVEALAALIAEGNLSDSVEMVLFAAAGMAGTPEAQALLASTLDDTGATDERRRSAAWSMIQLGDPSPSVVASLRTSLQSDASSPLMRTTSLLTVGAVSARQGGGEEQGRSLLETLLDEEDRARREGDLRVWLEALGNAGLAAALPRIEPYFRNPDSALRAAACSAVRKIQAPTATSHLCRLLRTDEDVQVRVAAAQYVAVRNGREVNDAAREIFLNESERFVLGTLIRGIGNRKPLGPQGERLLREFSSRTSDAELRQEALNILTGRG